MVREHTAASFDGTAIRLWPGVLAVALQWLAWLVLPAVFPGSTLYSVGGAVLLGLVVLCWWLFFSRLPWLERIGVVVVMVAAVFVTMRLVHASIANGMMGAMVPIYSVPSLSLALVAAAVITRARPAATRRAATIVAVLVTCGLFLLFRTGGITGDAGSDLHWRWTPTPEERLLARGDAVPMPPPVSALTRQADAPPSPEQAPPAIPAAAPVADVPEADADPGNDWPGFRGPARDGIVRGLQIDTDWTTHPPIELWRRPIGPGWSSFAVHGNVLFTQEQRGDDEIVAAYDVTNGKPLWMHRDATRFWESNAGAGPRATPTFSGGRLYSFGATGIVNALDARTGAVIWSRNAAADTGAEIPGWGFSSSPLIVDDLAIVAASGRLVGYDRSTGVPRWTATTQGGSYSSPHLVTIEGVTQVLMLSGGGVAGIAPADGSVLWDQAWPGGNANIVQPAMMPGSDLLIGAIDFNASGVGIRRITVTHASGKWVAAERWTSTALKPSFNDFVVLDGYAYGFDGGILAAVGLENGARTWKGGRYGHGQLVLLADQRLLLVLSEEGELALVSATPERFTELATFKAIDGKTWNHPVLVGDVLFVRNGEEMAAFQLTRADR